MLPKRVKSIIVLSLIGSVTVMIVAYTSPSLSKEWTMKMKYALSVAAAAVLAIGWTGCGSDSNDSKSVKSITFAPLALSANDTEKQQMRVSSKMTVTYSDDSTEEYPLAYKTLAKMGDTIGSGTMGLMVDKNGNPLKKSDGSNDISDGPDGNSFIKVGGKYRLITHLEERPGQLMNTEINVENNELVPVETAPVDLAAVGGTIINCASSKTPYGSHLGGEEDYSLNTRYADKNSPFYVDCALDGSSTDVGGEFNYFCNYVDQQAKYLLDTNIDKNNGYNGDSFSPYNYGYIVEVQPQADGTTKSAKHYVTGKYTPELATMMPDQKTVYMSDDGTFKGLWKFVSDSKISGFEANWSGTLYAAKVNQTSAANGGAFDVSWIELGHSSDNDLKTMIESKMKLTDIFEIAAPGDGNSCDTGFKYIAEDSAGECLKLKTGMETAAAFLETRKYAAYKDATIEFRKEEGMTYDKDRNVLYISMSAVEKSMEDNYKGMEAVNDIHLPKESCGAVYELTLDENYSGTKMEAIVVGKTLADTDANAAEWYCDPEGISNPDNITYIGHNTVLISEDTTKHVNNMSWAYNTQTKTMTRVASLPIGAEVTGVDVATAGSKGMIFLNAQHPFKDNPKNRAGDKPNTALIENATQEQLKAFIGYIDGMPSKLFN